jgi:hypothetical protein
MTVRNDEIGRSVDPHEAIFSQEFNGSWRAANTPIEERIRNFCARYAGLEDQYDFQENQQDLQMAQNLFVHAVVRGDFEGVSLLREVGVDPVQVRDMSGNSPLHLAVFCRNILMVRRCNRG